MKFKDFYFEFAAPARAVVCVAEKHADVVHARCDVWPETFRIASANEKERRFSSTFCIAVNVGGGSFEARFDPLRIPLARLRSLCLREADLHESLTELL